MRLLMTVSVLSKNCVLRAKYSPAPADRRRLPVNKDIVGTKEIAPYTGATRLLYKVVGVGAQMLSNLRLL